MENTIIQNYKNRVENFNIQKKELQKVNNWIAFIRIILFIGSFLLVYSLISATFYGYATFSVVLLFILFLYLVKVHANYKNKKNHCEILLNINKNEIKFHQGDLTPFDGGEELVEDEHPYIFDLDVFGSNSIFQLINRTNTSIGKKLLGDWLKYPFLKAANILENQDAVQDLSKRLDWRQNFQAVGLTWEESIEEKEDLIRWLNDPVTIVQKPFYKVMLWGFPLLTTICLLMAILSFVKVQVLFMFMIVQLFIVSLHLKTLLKYSLQISKKTKVLKKYAQLFKWIENEEFTSTKLKEMRQKLSNHKTSAHNSIHQLAEMVNYMEQGGSFVGIAFNGLFMWSLQYLYRIEKWQTIHKSHVQDWFEIAGEFDTLSSIANLCYNRPEYIFPNPVADTYQLVGKGIGHPLIESGVSVKNNVEFIDQGQFWIITGANMAGKSTYLRTVGVNFILAMIGAPVCAKEFTFRPMTIYTSMRTRDSLQSNESFFYAELKKLKKIIDKLEDREPIFVILDEILKGTNSLDQHTGSKALIEQLIKLNAVGLIATHDLSLGELIEEYPDKIQNKCFEIEINDQELAFDYKLRDGISQNLNATYLMKRMGITV